MQQNENIVAARQTLAGTRFSGNCLREGFSILDVENLRLHYAATIEHWSQRFETAADHIAATFDPAFVRACRLYLAGSLAAFRSGDMQLFQVVFSRSGCNKIPWSRREIYTPGRGATPVESGT